MKHKVIKINQDKNNTAKLRSATFPTNDGQGVTIYSIWINGFNIIIKPKIESEAVEFYNNFIKNVHRTVEKNDLDEIKLVKHTTDGGAVYLTDNHRFTEATVVIRLDGKHPELIGCKIKKGQ